MITRRAEARLPTPFGEFHVVGFEADADGSEHLALVMGEVRGISAVLLRVHSECLTGDVFGSLRCDCGGQLAAAMSAVAAAGTGVVIYSRGQEGRGIGLMRKLEAYALQDMGRDTVEANEELGFDADAREYSAAAAIVAALGIESIRLLSNNPAKRVGLEAAGVIVDEMVGLTVDTTRENRSYLETKAAKLGHLIDFDAADPAGS
jgi:3,4-dihydroxy 2-butanone 4-phosphate synthase/GTP cyclohydrolase II